MKELCDVVANVAINCCSFVWSHTPRVNQANNVCPEIIEDITETKVAVGDLKIIRNHWRDRVRS